MIDPLYRRLGLPVMLALLLWSLTLVLLIAVAGLIAGGW
jgi:hypothetical protein